MYQLSLIQNPSGTWSFVGSVPLRLAFDFDGNDKALEDLIKSEMLLPAKYRKVKSKVYQTRLDALKHAENLIHYYDGIHTYHDVKRELQDLLKRENF